MASTHSEDRRGGARSGACGGVGGATSGEGGTHGLPCHAFDAAFLDLLLERDSPPSAARAAVAGPWEVAAAAGGWRVHRQGEARHDEPAAWLEERQDALLLAAALPASVAGEDLKLRPERGPDGYDLVEAGGVVGRLAWFDPDLAALLSALRALVASPCGLALLLEAAGHDALDHAGRLLATRAGEEESS